MSECACRWKFRGYFPCSFSAIISSKAPRAFYSQFLAIHNSSNIKSYSVLLLFLGFVMLEDQVLHNAGPWRLYLNSQIIFLNNFNLKVDLYNKYLLSLVCNFTLGILVWVGVNHFRCGIFYYYALHLDIYEIFISLTWWSGFFWFDLDCRL